MGHHSFVPMDPLSRVLKLSEDLLRGGLSFSIALKIEGSVDFCLSNGQKSVRGAENTRGPSYTRRQIKRLMQRQTDPQKPQSASEEDVERAGGTGSFDNRTNSARDPRSEKINKSQTERSSKMQVARRAPQTSVVETQTIDVGRKQRSDEKKLRWLSNKLVATSGLASRLEERVDFHEKLQRANLRMLDYYITRLTTKGKAWDTDSWDGLSKADLMRDIFGFPDEETMLHLLENDSNLPENNDKTCDICPNCYSSSMSQNHVCNVNDDDDQ